MKLNKVLLSLSLALGCVSFVHAADDQGHGTVTFVGAITESPCSIDPETVDQTVNLGQISSTALKANENTGTSDPQNFEIKLLNCDVSTLKTVSATFTGAEGGTPGMLGMTGTAKGASIAMTDGSGKLLKLGEATSPQALGNGSNSMLFSAYLQGDGVDTEIEPGNFKSITNFTLAYQ